MLVPGARRLTTLDKTGFQKAAGLSVEIKGMCLGSVMKGGRGGERRGEREPGASFISGFPLRQLTAIKSECDSSHRQAPSGDSDHRYQRTLTSFCFITGRMLLMISNKPPAVHYRATAKKRTSSLLMRFIF